MDRALEHDTRSAARHTRRVDHADRDARHLPRHQARPARPGEQLLPAVDDPRLPRGVERPHRQPRPAGRHVRARPHLQPRIRDLHRGVAPAHDRLDDRPRRRDLPDRASHRPGARRRLPACERGGDHHRRLPRQPARHGPRHQQHRRGERHVRGAGAGRHPGADQLAARVPHLGAGRPVRDGVGVPQARGAEHPAAGADRLVGEHHLRARPGAGDGRRDVRHPPGRRPLDGVDERAGDRCSWPPRS